MRTRTLSALGTVLACSLSAAAQPTPIAFTDVHLIPISGPEIDHATLVTQSGKIIAAGPKDAVLVPSDAKIIQATGKVMMPGLIDTHSHIGGISGADGSSPIQPSIRIFDSLNPFDPGFRRAVAGGLTTINVMPGSGHLMGGQTVYLKLRSLPGVTPAGTGLKIDDFFILDGAGRPKGGMKMANGTNSQGNAPFPGTRAKSAALVREQFVKAQEYKAKIDAAKGDASKLPPRDLAMEGMLEVLDGTRTVHHHTHRADDIMTVLRLQREFGFKVVLQHVSEAWKVAPEIAKAGVPCSVIVVDAPGGKLEAAEMSWATGAILEKAGVHVAFHTDDWITDSRIFLRSAAMAVRAGMSRDGALRAVTLEGARMLDLSDRIGTLEPGKDADFILLSGDPFSVYTHIEQTWVEGAKVFDRSNADDLRYATGGYGASNPTKPYMCCTEQANQSSQGQ
jgi:imidazolonepropionase-like amidohydrolase